MSASRLLRFSPSIRWRLVIAALVVAATLALFQSAGRIIVRQDPLEPSDAIYVLGGSRVARPLEAYRLYREGYASKIVLSPGGREPAEVELGRERGIWVPTDADLARDLLLRLGLPAGAVIVLDRPLDNTAQEADGIRRLAAAEGWQRLIVISDLTSTRRVGHAFRRAFPDIRIIARASRDDLFDAARWWTTRASFRATFYEAPKLLAYWMGLGG